MTTKRFPLRDILTVTTGRLLTNGLGERDNGISALYKLLAHMTGEAPFTHQLGRFAEECKPWLLRWFPRLAEIDDAHLAPLDAAIMSAGPENGVEKWLAGLDLPAEFDVPPIPRDDHVAKDPYDELVEMRGTDEGIIIVKPEEKQ